MTEKTLANVPEKREKDVVHFDPSEAEMSFGLDIFNCSAEDREMVSREIARIILKLFHPDKNSDTNRRIEQFLQCAVVVAMHAAEPSFAELTKVVDNQTYRNELLEKVSFDFVRFYLSKPQDKILSPEEVRDVNYTMQRLQRLLAEDSIKRVTAPSTPELDLNTILTENKILLVNLAMGKLGQEASAFLSMLLQFKLMQTRWNQQPHSNNGFEPFYVYFDEIHNYMTWGLAVMLSEARNFWLSITLTSQFLGQTSKEEEMAIFGNCGTIIVFQTGSSDAEFLIHEFDPLITTTDIVDQPKYHAYVKTIYVNESIAPFSLDMTTKE